MKRLPAAGTLTSEPARPGSLPLLAWVAIAGTLPIHVFAPALPDLAADLHTSNRAAGQVMTAYLLGLSAGQLIYGPLADRHGRRPLLLIGLSGYTLASIVCAWSPSLLVLLTARFIQAIGGCAGLVLGRVMAADGADERQLARRLAVLGLATSASPALSPLLGAELTALLGWRGLLQVLSLINAVMLLVTVWSLRESRAAGWPRCSQAGARFIYGRLLRSRQFLFRAAGGACATVSFYAFIAAAPFIFSLRFHFTPQHFASVYFAVVSGVAAGNWSAQRMLAGQRKMLLTATSIMLTSAVAMLAAWLAGAFTPPVLIGAMMLYTFGTGLSGPLAFAAVVEAQGAFAGSASGLYGFLQMTFGAVCAAAVGATTGDPSLIMTLVLLSASLCAICLFWTAARPAGR
jgi:MFS transporter, DHA1 family, multidrug resistance protein